MDNTAVRIEPDATERELRESVDFADVESCVDDGGAAYVIHGMLPAEHAITTSPTLHEPDMARVDAALAQLRAELVDQRTMIRDLTYWSV
ncbi:MAG TPA: hypothetical protein VN085_00930 [Vicinamibacterales bacterium]|nr:hypothetical protein [Vicinamibacterales bacterium]